MATLPDRLRDRLFVAVHSIRLPDDEDEPANDTDPNRSGRLGLGPGYIIAIAVAAVLVVVLTLIGDSHIARILSAVTRTIVGILLVVGLARGLLRWWSR